MNKVMVQYFDGLAFLEELEKVFFLKGFDGVIKMVKKQIPVDACLEMDTNVERTDRNVYQIKSVVLSKLNPETVVFESGEKNSGTLVRSMNLSYLNIPFQFDIYGISIFENKN